jgi:hypothetical protein
MADLRSSTGDRERSTISAIFSSGCSQTMRLVLLLVAAVICVSSVVVPVLYVIVYLCANKGKLKGLIDSVGLLLQPLILAAKAARGTPRFNQIACKAPHKLFLGAQPDKYGGFRSLFSAHNIRTVVSLNSKIERLGNLWMSPPTEQDYRANDVEFIKVTLLDHHPLTVSMLAISADKINEGLQIGDVYVHCKAGQGRSAQAVLAYFLKHEHKPIDDAVNGIKHGRPNITLKTADQISALKASSKMHAKQQERYDFFKDFVREHCHVEHGPSADALNAVSKRKPHGKGEEATV